nr:DUF4312 family protein [Streptomyces sp. SID5785]
MRLSGSGPTREKAFATAIGQVQSEVARLTDGVNFRVEPLELDVVSAVEHRWTERFLGLLFPRTRQRFEITLSIQVQVASLDLDALDFTVREERLSPVRHALHMR